MIAGGLQFAKLLVVLRQRSVRASVTGIQLKGAEQPASGFFVVS
jgi:hypothetical protein